MKKILGQIVNGISVVTFILVICILGLIRSKYDTFHTSAPKAYSCLTEDSIKTALQIFKLDKYKVESYSGAFAYAAKKYKVDWKAIMANMITESYGDPFAVGDSIPKKTRKRARGLFQFLPSTYAMIAPNIGLPYKDQHSLNNPVVSIIAGTYYYAERLLVWGSMENAIKSYYLGDKWLQQYYKCGRTGVKFYKEMRVDEHWSRFQKFYNLICEGTY